MQTTMVLNNMTGNFTIDSVCDEFLVVNCTNFFLVNIHLNELRISPRILSQTFQTTSVHTCIYFYNVHY